mmetsp:Transcript_5540/g.11537  ORF Transcript_5540/g.11537 Transcript_5540/m.11537 type:complete len:311 (+) Transcript_5540:588-1520(+)
MPAQDAGARGGRPVRRPDVHDEAGQHGTVHEGDRFGGFLSGGGEIVESQVRPHGAQLQPARQARRRPPLHLPPPRHRLRSPQFQRPRVRLLRPPRRHGTALPPLRPLGPRHPRTLPPPSVRRGGADGVLRPHEVQGPHRRPAQVPVGVRGAPRSIPQDRGRQGLLHQIRQRHHERNQQPHRVRHGEAAGDTEGAGPDGQSPGVGRARRGEEGDDIGPARGERGVCPDRAAPVQPHTADAGFPQHRPGHTQPVPVGGNVPPPGQHALPRADQTGGVQGTGAQGRQPGVLPLPSQGYAEGPVRRVCQFRVRR